MASRKGDASPQGKQQVEIANDGSRMPFLADKETGLHAEISSVKLSSFRQLRAAFIANSAVIHPGLMFSFSAVALPQMQALDSHIVITADQASWIASIASFATPLGCLLGGVLMDRYGRRASLFLLSVPCILGWLTVGVTGLLGSYLGPSLAVPAIYTGRVMQGIGTGIVAGTSRVYTSEVSCPRLRGSLCSLASLGVSSGVLLGYTFGALVSWPFVALLAALVPLTSVTLSLIFLPETPTWLLQNNRPDDARKALERLRDPKTSCQDIDYELSQLGGQFETADQLKKSKLLVLCEPTNFKPLALVVFYFYSYQFSGISVLTFYNVEIVQRTGANVNGYLTAVCFGVIRFICTVTGCIVLSHFNRRTLTLFSGILSGLAMLSLGAHGYLTRNDLEPSDIFLWRYFPIGCIISFYVTYSLGYLLLPWVLLGEIYPAKSRGLLGGITSSFSHTFLFAAVKSFPFFIENLGFHGAFWFYGSTVTMGSIILFVLLPETRDKTLLEIESYFKPKNK